MTMRFSNDSLYFVLAMLDWLFIDYLSEGGRRWGTGEGEGRTRDLRTNLKRSERNKRNNRNFTPSRHFLLRNINLCWFSMTKIVPLIFSECSCHKNPSCWVTKKLPPQAFILQPPQDSVAMKCKSATIIVLWITGSIWLVFLKRLPHRNKSRVLL